eukprot:TRINITY_DN1946_c0_g1_i1.p1 TRINITY_DN1946_c0_g1~~TRINITY_DN1946_c0_g1_i1.p1  ORF type:complete len:328 (+),score=73.22 TRINITY_DN1946_c0_g1_i1:59-1042(+)
MAARAPLSLLFLLSALAVLCTPAVAAAAAAATHSDIELVHTPFGMLPKECVHDLDSASHLSHAPDGTTFVQELGGGRHRTPACPYDLSRYVNTREPNSAPSSRPARAPEVSHGWQAYTAWDYTGTGGISSFVGNFSVPDLPPQPTRDQILYIFTGLQNINWIPEPNNPLPTQAFDIIQPVLQYPGVHGSYWSIRSWYVTILSGAFASSEVKVPAGDVIFGNMTQTGPTTWFIESYSYAAKQSTNATVSHKRLALQPWAYCTLEVYNVDECSQYPDNAIQFSGMSMLDASGQPIAAAWDPIEGQQLACGESAQVNSPASVAINFQKQN